MSIYFQPLIVYRYSHICSNIAHTDTWYQYQCIPVNLELVIWHSCQQSKNFLEMTSCNIQSSGQTFTRLLNVSYFVGYLMHRKPYFHKLLVVKDWCCNIHAWFLFFFFNKRFWTIIENVIEPVQIDGLLLNLHYRYSMSLAASQVFPHALRLHLLSSACSPILISKGLSKLIKGIESCISSG